MSPRPRSERSRARRPAGRLTALATLIAVGAIDLTTTLGIGQQLPGFSEMLDVRLVELEVSVTDRQGQPIRGLERDDFRLTLDRESVDSDGFAEITGDGAGPLSVLLLVDSRTLRQASRERAFRELTPELGALLAGAGSRVRVVHYDGGIQSVQDWTRDLDEIEAALAAIAARPAWGESIDARESLAQQTLKDMLTNMRGSASERIVAMVSIDSLMGEIRRYAAEGLRETEDTLLGLQSVVRSLALTPGRKAIVYLSGGWAVRPGAGAMNRLQSALSGTSGGDNDPATSRVGQSDTPGASVLGDGGVMNRDVGQELLRGRQALESMDLGAELDLLIAVANAYRVRFYPVMAPPGDAAAADARGKGRGATEVSDIREGLVRLAQGTGGLAFLSETAIGGVLDSIGAAAGHHYSLTLGTARAPAAPWRELTIKVRQRGASVRFPRLLASRTIEERLLDLALAGLDSITTANPHRLELATLGQSPASGGRQQVQLALAFPISRLGLASASGLHQASSQVAVAVLDARGDLKEQQHLQVPLQIPEADLEKARASFYRAAIELRLEPGSHRVGVALWDAISQSASMVVQTIEVGG